MIQKKNSSVNLERWLWNYISKWDRNRSRLINHLIKEDIKETLITQQIMSQAEKVTETLGEVYLNLTLSKRKISHNSIVRTPVRSRTVIQGEDFIKQPICIQMEKWIWDLTRRIEPNRSLFIKKIILRKIKRDLQNSAVTICEEYLEDEVYIMKKTLELLDQKIS